MPNYQEIYANEPESYRELVAAEDYEGHLGPTLTSIATLDGARVLELGMGTGRVTRLLLERGAEVEGYDRSPGMLDVARSYLGEGRYRAHLADVRKTEFPGEEFEVAVAGWMLGHFCEWHSGNWRAEIDAVIDKACRALKPKGTLIIIETLGTFAAEPAPPNRDLASYYDHLVRDWGMSSRSIATDYRFTSVEQAVCLTTFFFGSEVGERVRKGGSLVVPEWTGVWWKMREV